jgi:6-phosphogluconolactonase
MYNLAMENGKRLGGRFLLAALGVIIACSNGLLGQVVFVPNANSNNLSAFVINAETGSLTELSPRVATQGQPTSVAADPKGRFVYATIDPPAVVGFRINASTGGLSPIAGLSQTLGGTPVGASVDPSGSYLYVANQGGNNVVAFSINATSGQLTRVAGTPFAAGQGPSGVLAEATGKFVFVTNERSNNVSAFVIDAATGALTPVPGSPFAAGRRPSRLAGDGAGKFLYVTNQDSNDVSGYAVDSATGALTPVPGSPFAAGAGPTAAAVDRTGSYLYVTNGDSASVSAYQIDAATGALSQIPGSPFRTRRGPFGAVFDSTGNYLYVPNLVSNNISAFAMDPATGALSALPGTPYDAGNRPGRPAFVQLTPAVLPPVVAQSALNAASRALPGLPNYGVAQGATFVVTGQNLGPGVKQTASFPLTAKLGGTSVEVTLGGVKKSALVVSASASEVTAILPSSVPVGDGTVTVTYNDRTSQSVPIRVVSASFGIFTRSQTGSGAAVALNNNSADDQPANSLFAAARPGQKMVLFGTGLGAVTWDETQAPPAQNLRDDVEVWVGNQRAEVSYSGRAPESPGMDRIDFTIPAGVTPGCYVPVGVRLAKAGVVSNFATLSVAGEGGACTDPNGLSAAELAPLSEGRSLNLGFLQLMRVNISATIPGLGSGTGMLDTGWGTFFRWDAAGAANDPGLDMFTARGTSLGACSVHVFRPRGPSWITWRANTLDGGAVLSLTGPKGAGKLAQSDPGFYEAHKALGALAPPGLFDALPPPYLEPGKITVSNGSGGAEVGAFEAALSIPESTAALEWTNFDSIAAAGVNRTSDLTFNWTGGDAATEYAVILGAVILPSMTAKEMQVAAGFVCAAPMTAGQLTVPSAVLSALPPSTPDDPTSGMLMVGRAPFLNDGLKFSAPGVDAGYLTLSRFKAAPATFR